MMMMVCVDMKFGDYIFMHVYVQSTNGKLMIPLRTCGFDQIL